MTSNEPTVPAWYLWPSLVVIRRGNPIRVEWTYAQSGAIRLKGWGFSGDSMDDTGASSGYGWAEHKGCLGTALRLWKRAQRLSGSRGEYWKDFPYRFYKFSCFNMCLGASLLNLLVCGWYPVESLISRGKGSIVLHLNWTRETECHIMRIFHLHTRTKPVCPAKVSLQCS